MDSPISWRPNARCLPAIEIFGKGVNLVPARDMFTLCHDRPARARIAGQPVSEITYSRLACPAVNLEYQSVKQGKLMASHKTRACAVLTFRALLVGFCH